MGQFPNKLGVFIAKIMVMNGGCAIASFDFRRLTIPKLDISWFNSKIIPILPPFFPVNPVN